MPRKFSLLMFFVAGAMALLIRAELFQPGLQFTDPRHYNELVTKHGFISGEIPGYR